MSFSYRNWKTSGRMVSPACPASAARMGDLVQVAAVTLIGAAMAGVAQFLAETLVFLVLRSLEKSGTVRRFNPSAKMQVRNFAASDQDSDGRIRNLGGRRRRTAA